MDTQPMKSEVVIKKGTTTIKKSKEGRKVGQGR